MDQLENLKRANTFQERMPEMMSDMTITRENVAYQDQNQVRFSVFEPVENEIEKNVDERISLNLEKVETIEKDRLVPPEQKEIEEAHRKVGVKMPSSPVKRSNRLKQSKAKFDRQKEFINKQRDALKLQNQSTNDLRQFMNLVDDPNFIDSLFSDKRGETADEFLVKKYDEINQKLKGLDNIRDTIAEDADFKEHEPKLKVLTQIKHFYDLQGQLVTNKYYTMLPTAEMQKLSSKELKMALLKEQGKETDKNEELINYYETLIKIKNCEIKDKKSAKEALNGEKEEKKEEINKQGTPEHEVEKIADGFVGFMMAVEADKFRASPADKWQQYNVFFDVVKKDLDRYQEKDGQSENVKKLLEMYKQYQQHKTLADDVLERNINEHIGDDEDLKEETRLQKGAGSAAITLNAEQKEGLRLVQSWLLRHATEKRWYRRDSKALEKSQNALALRVVQMPPEQQLLVFYLMENNIQSDGDPSHFYAALKDYVPNKAAFKGSVSWDKFSSAVRQTAKSAAYINEYAEIEDKINVLKDSEKNGTDKEKEASLFGEVAARYSMIALLSQSAGLSKNKDPELIEDKKIRDRIISEIQQANEALTKLRAMKADTSGAENEAKETQAKEKAFIEAIDKYLPKENAIKGGLEAVGGTGFAVGNIAAYAMTMHEAFFGILELGFALYSAANIRLSSPTSAEQGAVAMDTIGSLLSGIGNIVVPFGSALGSIAETAGATAAELTAKIAAHASGKAVMTEAELAQAMAGQTVAETTATTAYQAAQPLYQAGGALVMIAGGAKIVAQGVNIHRANKNLNIAEETEKTLEERTKNKKKNKDERRLARFLKHRKEGAKEEKRSAGLSMVSGAMTVIAGAMMMTGVLATLSLIPVLIGVGIDIANSVVGSKRRSLNRKNAVDTYLQMDNMVTKIKESPSFPWAEHMGEDELKDKLRTEMLAQMGYSSFEDCYKELIIGDAKLLYQKAFEDKDIDPAEQKMYEDAISSLGFKINRAPEGDLNGENKPTIQMMVAKLMK